MSDESREFYCNLLLIKALMQFLPVLERKKIQEWVTKLQDIEDGCAETKARNEYSFCLLVNVQNGTLSQPFNKPPPQGRLKPLCKTMPEILYEEMQKQIKVSYCKLNKMLNANGNEMPELKCEPSGFQSQQPRPQRGVSALFAVFSNYENESS